MLRDFPLHFFSVSVFELKDSEGLFCKVGIISLFGDVMRLFMLTSFGSFDIFDADCADFDSCGSGILGGDVVDVLDAHAAVAAATLVD